MRRRTRAGLAVLAFLALTTPTRPGPPRAPDGPAVAALRWSPVALNPDAPEQRRTGALRFVAGWSATSSDPRFGGISAMTVDGNRAVAISDAGVVLRFALPGPGPGAGPATVAITPLVDGPGDPARKRDRDTEAMALGPDHVWIAFENLNTVWRYRRSDGRAEAHAEPATMRDWPGNRGAEAMVRLADGRFLVVSESLQSDWTSDALLFPGDPADPATVPAPIRVRVPREYRVTDAAVLPDGRLLLLYRRFTLFGHISAKLLIADASGIVAGGVIEGEEIARLERPLTVDNMEALSVTIEGGRPIVWIASDDNFNPLQRTLLLKFELGC